MIATNKLNLLKFPLKTKSPIHKNKCKNIFSMFKQKHYKSQDHQDATE